MHELAVCRLTTASADVRGHISTFESDVAVIDVSEPLTEAAIGDTATLHVLDPVRGLCCYVGLLDHVTRTAVHVGVLERVATNQRRSAARAAYRVPVTGTLDGDDSTEPLPVTVIDVSASGVRFITSRLLTVGDVVRFQLPAGNQSVDLTARVLRSEEGQHDWRYGCELIDLDHRTREALFRLVLEQQRVAARRRNTAATAHP